MQDKPVRKPAANEAPRLPYSRLALYAGVVAVAAFVCWRTCFHVTLTNEHPSGTAIIAFGDSLTSGYGATAGHDYPSELSRLAGVQILNRGVAGETSGEALRRIDRDVLNADPRIVLILLGGNDLLRHVPSTETFRNLDEIVAKIQDRGALVVLVGIEGLMFTDNYGSEFKKLAKRRGTVYVKNIMSGIMDRPSLKSDQIHPNDAGYKMIAERLYPVIKPYIEH